MYTCILALPSFSLVKEKLFHIWYVMLQVKNVCCKIFVIIIFINCLECWIFFWEIEGSEKYFYDTNVLVFKTNRFWISSTKTSKMNDTIWNCNLNNFNLSAVSYGNLWGYARRVFIWSPCSCDKFWVSEKNYSIVKYIHILSEAASLRWQVLDKLFIL